LSGDYVDLDEFDDVMDEEQDDFDDLPEEPEYGYEARKPAKQNRQGKGKS